VFYIPLSGGSAREGGCPGLVSPPLPVINNARHVVFVAAGEDKARRVAPSEGGLQWFLDTQAAGGLTRAPVWTEGC
jgi:hypothetical protein